jgi:hypothetical protein
MRTIVTSNGMKRCLLFGAVALLMGVSAAARADLMVPTVTGADISVPSTIGTFHFSLPVNSVITRVILYSPEYSYVEAPSSFALQWDLDAPTFLLPLSAGSGSFFLGSVVPENLYAQIADGSVTLSVSCDSLSAPCPMDFDRTDSQDWRLWIEYDPPLTRTVDIDIRPGAMPNPVNLRSGGAIPVAVLSDSTFYAPTEVVHGSLTFGRLGSESSLRKCNQQPEDVNGDGLLDLVCHFETGGAGFFSADTQGVLMGVTSGGVNIKGTDSVRVVP